MAAQMICLWQEKTTKLLDAAGNLDFQKAGAHSKKVTGLRTNWPSQRRGQRAERRRWWKNARETAELVNAIQKFFDKQRYFSWDSGMGARIESGKVTLKEIEATS